MPDLNENSSEMVRDDLSENEQTFDEIRLLSPPETNEKYWAKQSQIHVK